MLYFEYCIRLGRTEEEFLKSSTAKVIRMLEISKFGIQKEQPAEVVQDMRDFLA